MSLKIALPTVGLLFVFLSAPAHSHKLTTGPEACVSANQDLADLYAISKAKDDMDEELFDSLENAIFNRAERNNCPDDVFLMEPKREAFTSGVRLFDLRDKYLGHEWKHGCNPQLVGACL